MTKPAPSQELPDWKELERRRKTWRYRIRARSYEIGRRTKYLLAQNWPEAIAVVVVTTCLAIAQYGC